MPLHPRDEKALPYRSLLFFGPPGAGKGTLCRFLSLAGGHVHLSSGDIFRGLSSDSPAGKVFHSYAGKGLLVPDEVTIGVWHHYVQELITANRYLPEKQLLLLDGIPRTLKQAGMLDSYVEIIQVVVLEMANVDHLFQRMQKRAQIEKRTDDWDENVLRKRMQVYEKETLGLLSHYPKERIARFNADQRPLEVLRDILDRFASLLSFNG